MTLNRGLKTRRILTLHGVILTGCLFVNGAVAAQEVSLQDKALAAGYKAMFTCSATFNAGKTTEQIAADELDNIYPDFGAGMKVILPTAP